MDRSMIDPSETMPDEKTFIVHGKMGAPVDKIVQAFEGRSKPFTLHEVVQGASFVIVKASEREVSEMLEGVDQVDFVEKDVEVRHGHADELDRELERTEALREQNQTKRRKALTAPAATPWFALNRLGVAEGQNTGKGVDVYVMDTGVRTRHEEFGGRAFPVLDVSSGKLQECQPHEIHCANDETGHGTAVAGAIAGTHLGVAPEARIFAVKMWPKTERAKLSWIITALDWVAKRKRDGPTLVVLNWFVRGTFRSIERATQRLADAGITVITAAGDLNEDACKFSPAHIPSTITVGALDIWTDRKAAFSNYGKCVDLWAPGSNVDAPAATTSLRYTRWSGSGIAAGLAAGVAATILQSRPKDSVTMLLKHMRMGAEKDKVTCIAHERASPNYVLQAVAVKPSNELSLTVHGAKSILRHATGSLPEAWCYLVKLGKQVQDLINRLETGPPVNDDAFNPEWAASPRELPGFQKSQGDALQCRIYSVARGGGSPTYFKLGEVDISGEDVVEKLRSGEPADFELQPQGTLRLSGTIRTYRPLQSTHRSRKFKPEDPCPEFAKYQPSRLQGRGNCLCPLATACSRAPDWRFPCPTVDNEKGDKVFDPRCRDCKCYRFTHTD